MRWRRGGGQAGGQGEPGVRRAVRGLRGLAASASASEARGTILTAGRGIRGNTECDDMRPLTIGRERALGSSRLRLEPAAVGLMGAGLSAVAAVIAAANVTPTSMVSLAAA